MRFLLILVFLISCSSKIEKRKNYIQLSQKKSQSMSVQKEKKAIDFKNCQTTCLNDVTSVYELETNDKGEKKCAHKFSFPCHPFGCDKEGFTCKAGCKEANDCASGASCNKVSAQCVVVSTPICKDDWSLVSPTGEEETCHGYRCVLHQCLQACHSDKDCAENYECLKNKCVED
jgi:hypothetical protein